MIKIYKQSWLQKIIILILALIMLCLANYDINEIAMSASEYGLITMIRWIICIGIVILIYGLVALTIKKPYIEFDYDHQKINVCQFAFLRKYIKYSLDFNQLNKISFKNVWDESILKSMNSRRMKFSKQVTSKWLSIVGVKFNVKDDVELPKKVHANRKNQITASFMYLNKKSINDLLNEISKVNQNLNNISDN